jgi:hypothetical protein
MTRGTVAPIFCDNENVHFIKMLICILHNLFARLNNGFKQVFKNI